MGVSVLGRLQRAPDRRLSLPDFSKDRAAVDRELDALLPASDGGDRIVEAMRYAVFGGAQRIRPALSLRAARLLNAETPAVLRAAAATELVHCASLAIDDLPCMDDSRTRRDRPSLHLQYGESTAIMAAFAMVALAARCVLDPAAANGCAARLARFQWKLLGVLDAGSLIRGQALDLQATTPARSALVTELKTVPLFELAMEAGGVSSAAYDRRASQFRKFARQYGLAFQMTDDYLDRDTVDADAVLGEIERARGLAAALSSGPNELMDLADYLHAKITEDRRHR